MSASNARKALVIGRGAGAEKSLRQLSKTNIKPVVYSANDAWLTLPADLRRRFPCDFTVSMDSNNHRETLRNREGKTPPYVNSIVLMQKWLAEHMPGVPQLVEHIKAREGCIDVPLVRPLNSGMAAVCYAAQNHPKVYVCGVSGYIDNKQFPEYRTEQLDLLSKHCEVSRIKWM